MGTVDGKRVETAQTEHTVGTSKQSSNEDKRREENCRNWMPCEVDKNLELMQIAKERKKEEKKGEDSEKISGGGTNGEVAPSDFAH